MMRIIGKGAIRNEKGSVLPLVLVLLVVGGLILTPLLGLMSTGLVSGQVYERKTDELYAADAGVEDAIWKVQHQVEGVPVPTCDDPDPEPWPYNMTDDTNKVNGKDVEVTITYVNNTTGELTYRIVSTAATADTGSSTTVESYVQFVPGVEFSIPGGALVSQNDLLVGKNSTVNGGMYHCGTLTCNKKECDNVTLHGNWTDQGCAGPDIFPQDQTDKLAQALRDRAMGGEPPPEDDVVHIDNDGNVVIDKDGGSVTWGPTYIAGDLNIGDSVTITWGPTYIGGDLIVGDNTRITLGGVLYVKGSIIAEKKLILTGEGSIVAEGDILLLRLNGYTLASDTIIMSLNGGIAINKDDGPSVRIDAFVYAPNGTITFGKYFEVHGSVVGDYIETLGGSVFTYAPTNWSGVFGSSVPTGLKTLTYTINP